MKRPFLKLPHRLLCTRIFERFVVFGNFVSVLRLMLALHLFTQSSIDGSEASMHFWSFHGVWSQVVFMIAATCEHFFFICSALALNLQPATPSYTAAASFLHLACSCCHYASHSSSTRYYLCTSAQHSKLLITT